MVFSTTNVINPFAPELLLPVYPVLPTVVLIVCALLSGIKPKMKSAMEKKL